MLLEFSQEIREIQEEIPSLNSKHQKGSDDEDTTWSDEGILEVFTRKKKLLKKVLVALKEDLTKEIDRANNAAGAENEMSKPSGIQRPSGLTDSKILSKSKLTTPVSQASKTDGFLSPSPEHTAKVSSSSTKIETSQSQRLNSARSNHKLQKIEGKHLSSQQLELENIQIDVGGKKPSVLRIIL